MQSRYKYLFLFPGLFTLIAIIIFPLVFTFRLSFSSWDVVQPTLDFIGFDNYVRVFNDTRFWESLGTLGTVVFSVVSLEYVIGFALALLLWQDIEKNRFFRVLFIIPMMATPVIISVVWRTMFHETLGPINDLLSMIHLPAVPWLSKPTSALIAVILVDIWQWTSFVFILLLAGLLSLPHEPYEAAAMDGANRFQIFWHITFPMMAPITIGILIIRIIEASKIMETVYVLTSGGPGTSTETSAYYIFIRSLREFQIGYSSAMSIVYLLMMILALTLIAKGLTKGLVSKGGI
ncbi:MAG: sugar ABC transporter permease [Deltaproteobacteria bacterium]|nr:sugar ABC transporter permease [Deltaproteobacteria bacterium]MBW2050324.1 sugar ABC transporter permease [Deltaproteobacteria bacterium]MBW2112849.1 sugar ABC transporter permease [Deltaproteobacteria bacterium]MBW2353611.1 sugar ABC transporter permease [Deltaproteobacteria bacterium]HDZ89314.1 sugar ABC transporter permease [Deltaproteobacteria bacterium]